MPAYDELALHLADQVRLTRERELRRRVAERAEHAARAERTDPECTPHTGLSERVEHGLPDRLLPRRA